VILDEEFHNPPRIDRRGAVGIAARPNVTGPLERNRSRRLLLLSVGAGPGRGYRMPSILCYKIEVVIGPLEISKSRCQMALAGLNSTRRIHAGGIADGARLWIQSTNFKLRTCSPSPRSAPSTSPLPIQRCSWCCQ